MFQWWQNTEFHPHSESLGLTPPEPTVILYGESEVLAGFLKFRTSQADRLFLFQAVEHMADVCIPLLVI
jgi:hypothetical protein